MVVRLVEKLQPGGATAEVDGIVHQIHPHPGARQRHIDDLANGGRRPLVSMIMRSDRSTASSRAVRQRVNQVLGVVSEAWGACTGATSAGCSDCIAGDRAALLTGFAIATAGAGVPVTSLKCTGEVMGSPVYLISAHRGRSRWARLIGSNRLNTNSDI